MSADTILLLKEKFNDLDANQDGTLDKEELMDLLVSLGGTMPSGDWEKLFDAMDEDKSGSVNLNEFMDFIFGGTEEEAAGEDLQWIADDKKQKLAHAAFDESATNGYINYPDVVEVVLKFCRQVGVTLSQMDMTEDDILGFIFGLNPMQELDVLSFVGFMRLANLILDFKYDPANGIVFPLPCKKCRNWDCEDCHYCGSGLCNKCRSKGKLVKPPNDDDGMEMRPTCEDCGHYPECSRTVDGRLIVD